MSNARQAVCHAARRSQRRGRTRWWWVRHAPVREDGGNIYGQKDMSCDCSDTRRVRRASQDAAAATRYGFASKLKRTHQTAAAIWDAGFPKPAAMPHEADLEEQNLGDWQGMNRAEFFASRPINVGSYWFAPIDEQSPNGESFMDLYQSRQRRHRAHQRRRMRAGTSSRSRMAARSRRRSALALGDQPEKGLAFTIDNCSVTRLDYLASDGHSGWRIRSSISSRGSPSGACGDASAGGPEVVPRNQPRSPDARSSACRREASA